MLGLFKKKYWVVKGKYKGDAGQNNPFYSSVLTEEEIQNIFEYINDPEMKLKMINDLKKQMILMEEV